MNLLAKSNKKPYTQPGMEKNPHSDDESVYTDEGRENLIEDEEITPAEGGFMEGYDEASDMDAEKEKTAANRDFSSEKTRRDGELSDEEDVDEED